MTVTTTLDRQYFDGDGSNKVFPFNFRFFTNDQIYVSLIAPDGTITLQNLTTNYTLSGALQAGGGTVTMVVAPPLTVPATRVFIQRILPQVQPTSIRNQGKFYPEIHEDAFDRLTMLIQQALAGLANALQLTFSKTGWNFLGYKGINVGTPTQPTDAATKGYVDSSSQGNNSYTDSQILRTVRGGSGEVLTQLPPAASRANKVMGFDASGNPLATLPASGSGTELAIDLANDLDPSKGPGMIGLDRELQYPPGTVGAAIKSAGVSPWEFADLLIYKPGIDPGGWDWSPAFNAAFSKYGELSPGRGRYGLGSTVFTEPGMRLRGHGPGHAGGTAYSDIFATVLIALPGFVGDAVFRGRINPPENVLTAPQLEQFRLDLSQCNSHGIHLSAAYDGVKMDNVHVVGTPDDKYAVWLDGGDYGLAQTLLATNVQCFGRASSTRTMAVARYDALNESLFIGCKWFGASAGVLASAGAAVEFAGCSGITMVGSSTAFSADGVAIVDHPIRKTNGFSMLSPTFEAHTRSAFTCKPDASRKATEVYIVAPRYYDSVFAMVNAIDVDNIERSSFDCQFKRAIVGFGGDQNTVYAQRQSYLTDNGTNTIIISTPNASDPYYAINKRIKAIGGVTCDSGLAQRVAVFTAATGAIPSSTKVVVVNRATIGTYSLPAANAFGAGFSMEIVIRGVGAGSISITAIGSDLIEGSTSLAIASGGKSRLVSDGVNSWYSV